MPRSAPMAMAVGRVSWHWATPQEVVRQREREGVAVRWRFGDRIERDAEFHTQRACYCASRSGRIAVEEAVRLKEMGLATEVIAVSNLPNRNHARNLWIALRGWLRTPANPPGTQASLT